MTKFTFHLVVTLSYMALLFMLSVLSGRPSPEEVGFSWIVTTTPSPLQNAMHVVCYGVLAFLLFRNLLTIPGVRVALTAAVAAAALCIAYGAVLEYWQGWVPGRYASVADALLNALGAAIGAAAGLRLHRLARKP